MIGCNFFVFILIQFCLNNDEYNFKSSTQVASVFPVLFFEYKFCVQLWKTFRHFASSVPWNSSNLKEVYLEEKYLPLWIFETLCFGDILSLKSSFYLTPSSNNNNMFNISPYLISYVLQRWTIFYRWDTWMIYSSLQWKRI